MIFVLDIEFAKHIAKIVLYVVFGSAVVLLLFRPWKTISKVWFMICYIIRTLYNRHHNIDSFICCMYMFNSGNIQPTELQRTFQGNIYIGMFLSCLVYDEYSNHKVS